MTFLKTLVLSLILVTAAAANEEPVVTIPLDQVWAYNMPGTKDVRQLEDQEKSKGRDAEGRIQNSLVDNTRSRLNLNFRPPERGHAESGFVVAETGLDALKRANAIFSNKKPKHNYYPAEEHFPDGEELTLVFFTYSCGCFVRLDEVTRTDREIFVKYHFHSHGLRRHAEHFALIPVGTFSKGTVQVRIKQMPDTSRRKDFDPLTMAYRRGMVRRIVCDSFSFGIIENRN